jgi:hypothetical protein
MSLAMLASLIAGAVGLGRTLLLAHVPNGGPSILVLVVLLAAAVFAALLLLNVMSIFWARWELTITSLTLTVSWHLFALRRSKTYPVADIAKLRIHQRKARGLLFQTIAFEHLGKTHHATPSLSADELEALMQGPLRQVAAPRA